MNKLKIGLPFGQLSFNRQLTDHINVLKLSSTWSLVLEQLETSCMVLRQMNTSRTAESKSRCACAAFLVLSNRRHPSTPIRGKRFMQEGCGRFHQPISACSFFPSVYKTSLHFFFFYIYILRDLIGRFF